MLPLLISLISSVWRAYWYLACTIFASFFIYAGFYVMYLPPAVHDKPIQFKFGSDCDRGLGGAVCSYPTADITLLGKNLKPEEGSRVLARGQAYTIDLELAMPTSPTNHKVGMFMVELALISKDNKTTSSCSKATMLKYVSFPVSMAKKLFYIIPYILGFMHEQQHIVIRMYDSFVDDSYHPIVSAKILLHSKHIQIYNARLKIVAIFAGLRYYMYIWPWTTAFVGFSMVFSLASLVALLMYFRNKEDFDEDDYADIFNGDEESDTELIGVENIGGSSSKTGSKATRNITKARRRLNKTEPASDILDQTAESAIEDDIMGD